MPRFLTLCLFLVCISLASGCPSSKSDQQNKSERAANDRVAEPPPKPIPLGSVYSTGTHNELKDAFKHYKPSGPRSFLEVLRRDTRVGASNVFLVKAKDFNEAVRLTFVVFTGGRPVDDVVFDANDIESKDYWVVAYLGGSGSAPPSFPIKSVERFGKTIRLTFGPRSSHGTDDVCPYFYWVPLGRLDAGTYTLELFPIRENRVSLARTVTTKD